MKNDSLKRSIVRMWLTNQRRPVQLSEYWSIDVYTHTFWLIVICHYVDAFKYEPLSYLQHECIHSIAFHKASSTDNKFRIFVIKY